MPKCYGYGRHSTSKQGMTREVQERSCREYYEKNLKSKGVEWVDFFYDAAKSGGKQFAERDQGRFVYYSLRQGDYLLVASADRLFRNKVDGFVTLDHLDRLGVKRVILDLPDLSGLDGDPELFDMLESNLVLYAHLYRRMASRKQRRDNDAKRQAGLPFSRSAPPGWKIVGTRQQKEYRVFPLERRMIDFMQTLRDDGESIERIALWSMGQREFHSDATPVRRFTTPARVLWALRAREAGYPKITSISDFNSALRSGQIVLCST